jgi:hypothetical protein
MQATMIVMLLTLSGFYPAPFGKTAQRGYVGVYHLDTAGPYHRPVVDV